MNIEDWHSIGVEDIDKAAHDLDTYLLPLLRNSALQDVKADDAGWQTRLLNECKDALAVVLPLRENERAFLNALLDVGDISPELFTDDTEFSDKIRRHPALFWKAQNVRAYRKAR